MLGISVFNGGRGGRPEGDRGDFGDAPRRGDDGGLSGVVSGSKNTSKAWYMGRKWSVYIAHVASCGSRQ